MLEKIKIMGGPIAEVAKWLLEGFEEKKNLSRRQDELGEFDELKEFERGNNLLRRGDEFEDLDSRVSCAMHHIYGILTSFPGASLA